MEIILTFGLGSILETVNEENYKAPAGLNMSERVKISTCQ